MQETDLERGGERVGFSIPKYGALKLSGIEDLEEAKKEALRFVTPKTGSELIEIQDSAGESVAIGYYDGVRFHWDEDKIGIASAKKLLFVMKPPVWKGNGGQGKDS